MFSNKSLFLLLCFSHISSMCLQFGAVQLYGERFFFPALAYTLFSLWSRITEQWGIFTTDCLMWNPTCVAFSQVSLSVWHCCQPSEILRVPCLWAGYDWAGRWPFLLRVILLDTLPKIFWGLLVWCSLNMSKAICADVLSYAIERALKVLEMFPMERKAWSMQRYPLLCACAHQVP